MPRGPVSIAYGRIAFNAHRIATGKTAEEEDFDRLTLAEKQVWATVAHAVLECRDELSDLMLG